MFFSTHVHEIMGPSSYISIAGKLNQCHLFTYLPALKIIINVLFVNISIQ